MSKEGGRECESWQLSSIQRQSRERWAKGGRKCESWQLSSIQRVKLRGFGKVYWSKKEK